MSKICHIINKTKSNTISQAAKVADNFYLRFSGLMLKKSILDQEALIFYNAPSIHTFFMRFPIDLVFLDKKMKVIKICDSLAPWKIVYCKASFLVIEFPSKKTTEKSLEIGDELEFKPANL